MKSKAWTKIDNKWKKVKIIEAKSNNYTGEAHMFDLVCKYKEGRVKHVITINYNDAFFDKPEEIKKPKDKYRWSRVLIGLPVYFSFFIISNIIIGVLVEKNWNDVLVGIISMILLTTALLFVPSIISEFYEMKERLDKLEESIDKP